MLAPSGWSWVTLCCVEHGGGRWLTDGRCSAAGPGFVQQVHVECTKCGGSGQHVARKDQCQERGCRQGVVRKKETIEAVVDQGMLDGQRITLRGKADEEYGKTTGDVVLIVKERQMPGVEFKRKGMDLITKMDISLGEALTGFKRVIKHLDGRDVVISSPAGKVVQHEAVKIISGEGMPKCVFSSSPSCWVVPFLILFILFASLCGPPVGHGRGAELRL